MHRMFETHRIRKEQDLCGLWHFHACGQETKAYVPGCWEYIPGFQRYRGTGVYDRSISIEEKSFVRFVLQALCVKIPQNTPKNNRISKMII